MIQHSTRSLQTKFIPTICFLTLLMLSSLALISFSIRTIPFLKLPTSIHLVTAQIHDLKAYSSASIFQFFHLASILSLVFIWKQAFSIPGTILLNILIGAIYGTWISTIFTCFLTAIGSTCAYQMARSTRPIVLRLFPTPLRMVERAVDRFKLPGSSNLYDTAELSSYLLLARFLPVVPYAALNLASGVLELPLVPFFWTLVLGSLPYNFLTTQVGDILSTAATGHSNLSNIWSNTLLLKLAFVSLLGALPVLFKKQLRASIQALSQNRCSPLIHKSSTLSPFQKGRLERHQSTREWVSDIGSRRKSVSIFDQSNLSHPLHCIIPPSTFTPDSSSDVDVDHSDLQSELGRTTSSSSPSVQEHDKSNATLVINFESPNYDDNPEPHLESLSAMHIDPSMTNLQGLDLQTHDFNVISHSLPIFLSKSPQPKPNGDVGNSDLSIYSLFDLPCRKVGKIVSDNVLLPV